jgi:hypothetical protein
MKWLTEQVSTARWMMLVLYFILFTEIMGWLGVGPAAR